MTPKQKALELFEKFKPIAHANLFSFREESHIRNCKLGALIVVDEILNIDYFDMTENYFNDHIEYWQKVKEEIENL